MTRKEAIRIEKKFKLHDVYKPYVSTLDDGRLSVESYPLEVRATEGLDRDNGPFHTLELRDCSLLRTGQDSLVETEIVYWGSPLVSRIADMIVAHHKEARDRAKQQEAEFIKQSRAAK